MPRNRKKLSLLIGTVAFAGTMALAQVQASTYYVRAGGDDRADGKTAKTAFRSISSAFAILNHGDGVLIGPGTYREAVMLAERYGTVEAPIAIVGDESGKATGDAAGPVVVEPLRPSDPALFFHRISQFVISGLTLRGGGSGTRIKQCRDVLAERCSFDGLAVGLSVETCQHVRVESSLFARCNIGLTVRASAGVRLAHLTVASCGTAGFMIAGCGEGAIRNCLFTASNSNFLLDPVSAMAWTSDHNVLTGTTGPWGQGYPVSVPSEWYSATGQDRHSMYVVPAFVDPGAFDLRIAPDVSWGGGLPGMTTGMALDPPVKLDRDGRPFREQKNGVCTGAYDYPDPKPAERWRTTGVDLGGRGPRQSAGVYTKDGDLLRMLLADAAGVHEVWWDGRDDMGKPVAAGDYEIRYVTGDARLVDDGSVGDNGCSLGTYNCDNPELIVAFPDGRFIVATTYDEAGIPLRLHAATGQPIYGSNLTEKYFTGLARSGDEVIGVVNQPPDAKLVRIVLPGERAPMANGAESYPILSDDERKTVMEDNKRQQDWQQEKEKREREYREAVAKAKAANQPPPAAPEAKPKPVSHSIGGLAVFGDTAYVALSGMDKIRMISLADGTRKGDLAVPSLRDIETDSGGKLWALSSTDVVQLDAKGQVVKKYATGLVNPRYLAVGPNRIAAVHVWQRQISLLDATSGKIIKIMGKDLPGNAWLKTGGETFRSPRDAAFLPDGRLIVADHLRIRCLWPETGQIVFDQESTFLDICIPHPQKPEFVYSRMGVMRVDEKTGQWTLLTQYPADNPVGEQYLSTVALLGGRPFLISNGMEAGFQKFFDISDPLNPRLVLDFKDRTEELQKSGMIPTAIGKDSVLVCVDTTAEPSQVIRVVPFKGLTGPGQAPEWDIDKMASIKVLPDVAGRGTFFRHSFSIDPKTGDCYGLAVTSIFNKMVPAWGADGTGVARVTPDGRIRWFAPSSGNNYQALASVHDGKAFWTFACKSFGGQTDVFDADGLRIATGTWAWPANWISGFVDFYEGITAYMRADGKLGAYIEDDNVDRFLRCRLDGLETVQQNSYPLRWEGGAQPGKPALADSTGRDLVRQKTIPRVPELKVDGDWPAWERAGMVPQIIALPVVSWGRIFPEQLFDTYRVGTAVGAVSHDGKSFLVYFLVTDNTPNFTTGPADMWMADSIELWLEQEQFGLGFQRDGKPALFKYRYHNRQGSEFAADYSLPEVWGTVIADVASHPLGKVLESSIGASMAGKAGYATMARIPFEEVKLVGGMLNVPGREGTVKLDTTGKPGEIVRVAVAFDGIEHWSREQDFKVCWPGSLMFSDPTRSMPFVFAGKAPEKQTPQ